MPRFIYIAGPLSNHDLIVRQANIDAAILAADTLLEAGHFPFVPHLFQTWHDLLPHSRSTWLELDLAWLSRCDALLRLEGPSEGRDLEVLEARRLNIPVFSSISELLSSSANGSLR